MSELSERIKGALLPKPLCRDCADRNGRCHDGEFCDPEERAEELSELVKAQQQSRDELLDASIKFNKRVLECPLLIPIEPLLKITDVTGQLEIGEPRGMR